MNENIEEIPSTEIEPITENSDTKIEESIQPISTSERQPKIVLRSILRWALILLITFGLGVLTIYFAFLLPTTKDLKQARADLTEAADTIDDLESQIAELNQINEELESQLDSAKLRLMLLSAISDVRAANLAALDDNYAGALLSLKDASQTLELLNDILGEDQSEIITTMQENLNDIQLTLKSDLESAKSDLDRLTTNLIRLEKAILK